jgi:nucleotide-binding universal stress UspA family protein
MKTIAVLIDLSERADNAAQYALLLAQQLHARVVLHNCYIVPSAQPLGAQIAWPMEDADELENDSNKALAILAEKLRMKTLKFAQGAYRPVVDYKCHLGLLEEYMEEFSADKDNVLVVMASHHKGFSSFVMGNHIRQVIDSVKLPLLIIPAGYQFAGINKIAFASDFYKDDFNVIHSLSSLASCLNAELLIAHVVEDGAENQDRGARMTSFLKDIGNKANYPRIYYREVKSIDVDHGIDWLAEHGQIDMLVLVHQPKSFLERIFRHSHTKAIAGHINLPLIIYPGPTNTLPVF